MGGLAYQGIWGGTPWSWLVLGAFLASMNGCVLLAVGILGEYVGRIHEQVKDRPLYLLQETSDDRASGTLSLPDEAA